MPRVASSSIVVVACSVLFSLQLQAKTLTPAAAARVKTLTLSGLQYAYNFEFDEANRLLNEAISLEPLHPRPHLAKSAIALWHALIGNRSLLREQFMSLADSTIDVCERYEEAYGEDADVKVCLGTIYGYKSFVNARTKSYLSSAWDARKSYNYFADALALDPHAYDAYVGIGVYHYFTDFVPKALRWIVNILGISGDSDLGLRELRLAAEKGTYTTVEARYYIAQFLPWSNNDFTASELMLDSLSREFPRNSLLRFTLGVWKIRNHDAASARTLLQSVLQDSIYTIDGMQSFIRYKLAECYFRLGEYDKARELYIAFLKSYEDETYIGTSCYRIALCYEMAGQRDRAMVFYRRAAETDRTFGDDAYSSRQAKLLLQAPLDSSAVLLLTATNALYSGKFAQAKGLCSKLLALPRVRDECRAEALYRLGETYAELHAYTDALQHFQQAIDMNNQHERWIIPWSQYKTGLCRLQLRDTSSAETAFKNVLEASDYDFQNWLQFRAERELKKLQPK